MKTSFIINSADFLNFEKCQTVDKHSDPHRASINHTGHQFLLQGERTYIVLSSTTDSDQAAPLVIAGRFHTEDVRLYQGFYSLNRSEHGSDICSVERTLTCRKHTTYSTCPHHVQCNLPVLSPPQPFHYATKHICAFGAIASRRE